MDLNQDAIKDLPEGLDDDGLVKPPLDIDKNQLNTVITVKSDDVSDDVNEHLSEADMKTITESDVAFKTVEEGVEKVTELQEVESELIAQESIGQDFVKRAMQIFGDMFSQAISLESYTERPSKTNYQSTVKLVHQRVAIEEDNVITNFSGLTAQSVRDTVKVLERIREKYLFEFSLNMRSSASDARAFLEDTSVLKNAVISTQKEGVDSFINLTTDDIASIDFESNQVDLPFQAALVNLRTMLSDDYIRLLVLATTECQSSSLLLNWTNHSNIVNTPINLLTVAKFLNSPDFKTLLESFDDTINVSINYLNEFLESAESITAYKELTDLLIVKGPGVSDCFNKTSCIVKIILTITQLSISFKTLSELLICSPKE